MSRTLTGMSTILAGAALVAALHHPSLAWVEDDQPIGGAPADGPSVEEGRPLGGVPVYGDPSADPPLGGAAVGGEPVEEGRPLDGGDTYGQPVEEGEPPQGAPLE